MLLKKWGTNTTCTIQALKKEIEIKNAKRRHLSFNLDSHSLADD